MALGERFESLLGWPDVSPVVPCQFFAVCLSERLRLAELLARGARLTARLLPPGGTLFFPHSFGIAGAKLPVTPVKVGRKKNAQVVGVVVRANSTRQAIFDTLRITYWPVQPYTSNRLGGSVTVRTFSLDVALRVVAMAGICFPLP